MLGHAAARQPAPMLAMRPIGLRLRHGVDALGNAIGDSLASSGGADWSKAPDQSDAETARLNRYAVMQPDAATVIDNRPYSGNFPDVAALAASAPTFAGGYVAPSYGSDILLAAGPGYSGLGVNPDSMESIRGADGVYRVDIVGSDSPVGSGGVIEQLPRVVVTGRRAADADVEQDLQAQNDEQVIGGTYNKFGAAWDSAWNGNWSQALFHLNYTPSGAAKQAVYNRVFPQAMLRGSSKTGNG